MLRLYAEETLCVAVSFRTAQAVRFFSEAVKQDLAHQIQEALKRAASAPQTRETKPIPRWTLKKLVQWIERKWQLNCCRETVRKALKKMGFSGKKAKKLRG